MKRFLSAVVLCFSLASAFAQIADRQEDELAVKKKRSAFLLQQQPAEDPGTASGLSIEKINPATGIKNQGNSGTCWCFSTTSLVESQFLKANPNKAVDISEMYIVRKIYLEKAENYLLRQGHAQFSEGGLGHDLIRAIGTYGAVPETEYSGLQNGAATYDHQKLFLELKSGLDTIIKQDLANKAGAKVDWRLWVEKILDLYMGPVPAKFNYEGNNYTPKTFATEYLKFNADDYVNITSFTNKPYYSPFIISVPDNFSNGSYYNLPLDEMIDATKDAIKNGYTILWDADVSNNGFSQKHGVALNISEAASIATDSAIGMAEDRWTSLKRQTLFENLVTQDDHLMHIIGLEKTKSGRSFFMVKNSWGAVGPYKGYINVSEPYFAMNTISLVLPKAALSRTLLNKLKIN